MSLGIMCQWLSEKKKRDGTIYYENIIDEKSLQLGAYRSGKYSHERIQETYRHNVKTHLDIIPTLIQNNIKSFRISSSLFPLFEFCGDIAKSDPQIIADLQKLGTLFMQNGIRVTTHPGQFCVISSDSDKTVINSIKELEYHAWMFDMMGFDKTPYYAINIHGGKKNRSQKIIDVSKTLPDNVRKRLTLENDEKCYNVRDLINIHNHTNIPIVFDAHHFNFGVDDVSFDDAFNQSMHTWDSIKPLQHISNTEIGMENATFNKKRAHSQMIHNVPELQLIALRNNLIDVDVEAKMKNIALLKMRKDFGIEL